jgi:hypothetical protein
LSIYDPSLHLSANEQFATSLKKVKVVPWATERQENIDKLLSEVEEEITLLFLNNIAGTFSVEEVVRLKACEARKTKLLMYSEAEWCLRSRAIWLELGNENSRYYQKLHHIDRM